MALHGNPSAGLIYYDAATNLASIVFKYVGFNMLCQKKKAFGQHA